MSAEDLKRARAVAAKEPAAIDAFVEEFSSPMLGAARAWGLPQADAEEAVQDALVDSLEALKRFEGRSSLKSFLFSILYNKCRERRRKDARAQGVDDIEAVFEGRFGMLGIWNSLPRGPEEEAVNTELADWLKRCAEGLALDQRAAFQLKVVEARDTEEVCKILGVSATNLGVLLFRSRNKLRECLEKKWIKR